MTDYVYDDNDRLLSEGVNSYTYDNQGNVLTETDAISTKRYTYNTNQQLTNYRDAINNVYFKYNPENIRVEKTVNGDTTEYIIDSNQAYQQVVAEQDESETIQKEYLYGNDLISQNNQGSTHFYHYDSLGTTRALSDDSGSISDEYAYEAFGELLGQTGDTDNDYLHTGEQFDVELDNYYLRARYYNQGVGRLTQMDTYQGRMGEPLTLHKYMYTHADPINNIDPTGNISLAGFAVSTNINKILTATAVTTIGASLYDSIALDNDPLRIPAFKERTYADVQLGKYQVRRCARSGGKDCKSNIPLLIFGMDVGEAAIHTFDAQMSGLTPVLSRVPRQGWKPNKQKECIGRTGGISGNECDEYPFASSAQGGPMNYRANKVSLRPIYKSHNRSQGGKLSGFYRSCNVRAGDPVKQWFSVAVNLASPRTVKICPKN